MKTKVIDRKKKTRGERYLGGGGGVKENNTEGQSERAEERVRDRERERGREKEGTQ